MKAHVMMIAGLFLAAVPTVGHSQHAKMEDASCVARTPSYSRVHLENAARNYTVGLKSDVDGLVESSIAYSMLLRVVAPELELSDIRAELHNIIRSGNTPAIRYKAYLATIVFENPRAFENALGDEGAYDNQVFALVAEHVSKTLLGYNMK